MVMQATYLRIKRDNGPAVRLKCQRLVARFFEVIQGRPTAFCFGHAIEPRTKLVGCGKVGALEYVFGVFDQRRITNARFSGNFPPRHAAVQFALKIGLPFRQFGFVHAWPPLCRIIHCIVIWYTTFGYLSTEVAMDVLTSL